MDAGLLELLSADEEARARIGAESRAADARIAEARAAREAARIERERAGRAALDAEVEAIVSAARREVELRRERRAKDLAERARAAEALLPGAAREQARIVLEGVDGARR